jgi:hypothetical protein
MNRVVDPLNRWPSFVGAVHRRLEAGRSIYGDRSFANDPAKLLAEVQAELLDVAGWAFVLWVRLERIREALTANAPPSASSGTE